jgi:hypothetical protein
MHSCANSGASEVSPREGGRADLKAGCRISALPVVVSSCWLTHWYASVSRLCAKVRCRDSRRRAQRVVVELAGWFVLTERAEVRGEIVGRISEGLFSCRCRDRFIHRMWRVGQQGTEFEQTDDNDVHAESDDADVDVTDRGGVDERKIDDRRLAGE